MNKLFSKLGTLLLGASLVVAGGVAVSSKKASEAKASEATAYTLNGSISATGNTYNGENEVTQGGVTWKINGNVNTTPWRIGGNQKNGLSTAGTIRHIQSQGPVSTEDITKIVITCSQASSSSSRITPTDVSLKVGTAAGGSQTGTLSNGSYSTSVTFNRPSGQNWSSKYFEVDFTMPANKTDTNKFILVNSVTFYYESSTPRGDIVINDVGGRVLTVSDSKTLSYSWTPASGSSATISQSSWSSSNNEVLTVSGNQITAVGAGYATITLTAKDSLNEEYSVETERFYVTNEYDFEVGDNVALYASGVTQELSSITGGSSSYGAGVAYSTNPNGTYLLNVEEGTVAGSLSFKNGDNYLTNTNSKLNIASTKTDNSSWFYVVYEEYTVLVSVADPLMEIWYNSSSPRFQLYSGKTPSTANYYYSSLYKIAEVPVRGTLEITSPTDKVMRGDASGELTYNWTPNEEAPSVTISSHNWVSSNPDAISVSGDTYNAEGAGKAKLTLTATDSSGEEYTVIGSEIEVVAVVSGSYEKKTSVAVGDTVTFVCEAEGTQIAGVASNIGQYVFYETKPADTYVFVLEAGSETNSYALKHDDKYLSWTGHGSSTSANIGLVDSVDEYSSWTIEFDEGNAVISNVGLDGEAHRYIAWNNSSPRFAAYKTGQTAIQLYGPAATPAEYDAVTFATELINLTNDQCSVYGTGSYNYEESKAAFVSLWSTLGGNEHYGKLTSDQVAILVEANADADSENVVEVAMYRYDLITVKYGLDGFITNREPQLSIYVPVYESNVDSSTSVAIIVVIAVASMTLLGTTLVIRKRKHQ